MRRLRFFIALFGLVNGLSAQMAKDVFPLNRQYRAGGLFISPELNYLLPLFPSTKKESDGNTSYDYDVNGSGKIGYGLEVGWFHSFKQERFVDYLEAGIGYRQFNGEAVHQGTLRSTNNTRSYASDNSFSASLIQASLRASHVSELGKNRFIVNSLGVNANYFVSEEYDRGTSYPTRYEEFVENPLIQLHYQFGYGFRVSKLIYLIPSLETPLFNVFPINDISSGFKFYSLDYQPLIFKLRLMFLREDPVNCNAPVYNGPPNPQ